MLIKRYKLQLISFSIRRGCKVIGGTDNNATVECSKVWHNLWRSTDNILLST